MTGGRLSSRLWPSSNSPTPGTPQSSRVFGGNYDPGPAEDEVNGWVAEALREVAVAADPYGIRLALETHDAFSTGQRVRRVLDLADHTGIGIVWDFAHPLRHGETVDQTWNLIHRDVIHAHFKDMKLTGGGRDGWESVGPGQGDLPLADMVGRLAQAHYDGYLSTEWEGRDPDGADDPTDMLRAHTASHPQPDRQGANDLTFLHRVRPPGIHDIRKAVDSPASRAYA